MTASSATESDCRQLRPLTIRVRFEGEPARNVVIQSTLPSGIRLLDPASGKELWSAGPAASSTQVFAGMDSGFGSSFTAVQLDADGVHDRLYAGDRAGRLWRLDLRAGARRAEWMRATILVDLGVPGGGRGFVARPDVTRIELAESSWLNIAIGTANTGAPRNDHRFYVLRDSLAGPPEATLHETDLEQLSPPAGITQGNGHGYFLPLGSAQVLAQSLTLNGRIHFTAAETARSLMAACGADEVPEASVPVSVTTLRARDGELAPASQDIASSAGLRVPVSDHLAASTGVELAATAAGPHDLVQCRIGREALPGCALDTRPHRSWWRREDAD